MNKIKVLIIDDSAITRSILRAILEKDVGIEVVDTAIDPIIAGKKIAKFRPDVITLDLEMPRMDGITFLQKLMRNSPLPVVVISGSSEKAIMSLSLGAAEVIEKPDLSTPEKLKEVSDVICRSVRNAYNAKVNSIKKYIRSPKFPQKKMDRPIKGPFIGKPATSIIMIGASTGGPETIKEIIANLDITPFGIVIAQHMPASFTGSFAERLDSFSNGLVKEAEDGEYIESGKALLIPGNYHGTIGIDSKGYYIRLDQEDKVNRHRPSVDVLFKSAANVLGKKALGILLTGMGKDGAEGLLSMKNNEAFTIAQTEDSCVVYGMPRQAVVLNAATQQFSPEEIIAYLSDK